MARSIWSGAISFGLVNVPVKLYSATSHKEVHFNMLHKKDGARIKQQRVCAEEGVEVPWEEIAKGYEISPGRYVMLDKDELAALNPKADKSIAIEDFVNQSEIDPIFYENAYYLAPDRGAAKPYALLLEAMKKTGKVGIARVVLRTRQYLAAVRPMGKGLALSTMLYADEVNPVEEIEELPGPESKPKDRELEMAQQLIESLSTKFEPEKYTDEHREQVLALIEKKAKGEEIVVAQEPEEPAKVVNLMDALQKSLAALRDKNAQGAAAADASSEKGEARQKAQAAKTTAPKKKSGGAPKKRKSA
ncbi:MAG TPA: Ku protein [Myxococcaceae bacterium]|nr:Ku protein [Myxococcaceae bacterium]